MIVFLDSESAFDKKKKIQHPFLIKVLKISGIGGTYLSMIKEIYFITANINLKGKKLKRFLLKLEIRQDFPLPPYLVRIVLEVLAKSIKKTIEGDQGTTKKETEIKISLFVNDMIVCIYIYISMYVYISQNIHQKTLTADKHSQQSSRIQNKHTKISVHPK